jgi:hypothetical protein
MHTHCNLYIAFDSINLIGERLNSYLQTGDLRRRLSLSVPIAKTGQLWSSSEEPIAQH